MTFIKFHLNYTKKQDDIHKFSNVWFGCRFLAVIFFLLKAVCMTFAKFRRNCTNKNKPHVPRNTTRQHQPSQIPIDNAVIVSGYRAIAGHVAQLLQDILLWPRTIVVRIWTPDAPGRPAQDGKKPPPMGGINFARTKLFPMTCGFGVCVQFNKLRRKNHMVRP